MPSEVKWGISLLVGLGLVALGWRYVWVLQTLHYMICFLLIVVVLLQSGKAADLAGAFGGAGSQTAFGPRGAATFLSKATTWCAIMFMITAVSLGLRQTGVVTGGGTGSILEEIQQQKPAEPAPTQPGTGGAQPTPTPQSQAPGQTAPGTPAQGQPATGTTPAPAESAPAKEPAKAPPKQPGQE